jgi:hypothetical protein
VCTLYISWAPVCFSRQWTCPLGQHCQAFHQQPAHTLELDSKLKVENMSFSMPKKSWVVLVSPDDSLA